MLELHLELLLNNFQQNLPIQVGKKIYFIIDKYLACNLAINECAVNLSILLARDSINSGFSLTTSARVVLSVDSYC